MNIYSDVIEKLKKDGYDAEVVEKDKNGLPVLGLKIQTGSSVEPVVYLNDEMSLEEALNDCYNAIDSASKLNDPKDFTDKDFILDNAYLCLEKVHDCDYITFTTEFYDLQAYIRVFIDEHSSFKLTEELLERAKLPKGTIYDSALWNTVFDARLRTVEECIGFPKQSFQDCLFAVLDNPRGSYGTGAILSEDFQNFIKNQMNAKKLIVIPSSIHELILVNGDYNTEGLQPIIDMVKEVNATVVDAFETLTDNAYYI